MTELDMRMMDKLKEKLEKELEDVARKPDMKAGDLDMLHKLIDTIKNIDKICMLEDEEGGYSRDGDMRASYERGSSYARRRRDSRGRYSRDGDYSNTGNYSRNGGYSRAANEMMEELREMMEGATKEDKDAIRQFIGSMR